MNREMFGQNHKECREKRKEKTNGVKVGRKKHKD